MGSFSTCLTNNYLILKIRFFPKKNSKILQKILNLLHQNKLVFFEKNKISKFQNFLKVIIIYLGALAGGTQVLWFDWYLPELKKSEMVSLVLGGTQH